MDLLQTSHFHGTAEAQVITLQLSIAVLNLAYKLLMLFLEKKNLKQHSDYLLSLKITILCI